MPLLWYGWRIQHESSAEKVEITDIAPTISDWLNISYPSGCTGNPITVIPLKWKSHLNIRMFLLMKNKTSSMKNYERCRRNLCAFWVCRNDISSARKLIHRKSNFIWRNNFWRIFGLEDGIIEFFVPFESSFGNSNLTRENLRDWLLRNLFIDDNILLSFDAASHVVDFRNGCLNII